MDIYSARQGIIDTLQQELTGAVAPRDISPHRGQFESLKEIQNISTQSPAVRVAFRALESTQPQHDQTQMDVFWVIHVIAHSTRQDQRNQLAGGIAVAIVDVIAHLGNTWPWADDVPTRLRAVDLSTLNLDRNGISLWQVTWQQRGLFDRVQALPPLDTFEGFDSDHYAPGADPETAEPQAQTTDTYTE